MVFQWMMCFDNQVAGSASIDVLEMHGIVLISSSSNLVNANLIQG